MPRERIDYEARFAIALRRIKAYMSPEQLRRRSEREYGLEYTEALEMAYENVLAEAFLALHGYRPKRVKASAAAEAGVPVSEVN
jgi:hypothetical protein